MNESGQPNDTPESIADSLSEVVTDVEQFVLEYLNRLSTALEISQSKDRERNEIPVAAAPRRDRAEKVHQSIEQFEQDKASWEQHRMLQEQEIQRRFEQLTEAWLRLEEEQRIFIQTKEQRTGVQFSNRSETTSPFQLSPNPAQRESPGEISREGKETQHAGSERFLSGGHATNENNNDRSRDANTRSNTGSREAAVLQFEKLRREIDASRPPLGPR